MPTLTLRLGDLSVGFIQSLTDAVNSFDRNLTRCWSSTVLTRFA